MNDDEEKNIYCCFDGHDVVDGNATRTWRYILDIALSCAYEDQGAFARAFKRFYGITPTEYLARK